ncbi:MAG: uroporphyrinogen-III C-methyltransferase, partial [Gammaproteobacteria bacterium]|nr:uroporphyrinogen-III C-methyltransferase [Gammaproteobacteria bacterium]
AVRERVSAPGARRRLWEELLGGAAARHVLAGDEHAADALTRNLLDLAAGETRAGCAWLVGAGPGDPELISVRGLQVLREADVVLHDRLVSPELLRAARREADIICVGKQGGGPSTPQEEINRILVERVQRGQRVCRLKGGDPFIFGRGGEEALALAAAGLNFEIVPGITAASGCAARAGIPLTHRGLSAAVTLVSAQAAAGSPGPDWAHLAAGAGTLAIYMGAGQVGTIVENLLRHGRPADTPAALITSGTMDGERIVAGSLADIGARSGARDESAPGILIIGATVALGDALGAKPGIGPERGAAERLRDPILSPPFIRAG